MAWERSRIYYSKLPDTGDDRKTVLVVSSDVVGEFLSPIVVQVTSNPRIRVLPTFVELRAGEGGLERNSWALCHEIATADDSLIDEDPLGPPISPRKVAEVNRALAEALDLPPWWPSA